ncbi:MAG: PKD domain-containing protein [Thermoplasmata archaeon]|nr:PKD domain-containing protein [Thermoplasmata archaeon]
MHRPPGRPQPHWDPRRAAGALAVGVIVALLALGPGGGIVSMARAGPAPAAGLTLSVAGQTPAAIGLTWTEATDLGFNGYEVYEAPSASGPWTNLGSVSVASQTSYFVGGLTPNGTGWWKVVENELLSGSVDSNPVQATQPGVAALQVSPVNASTVALHWTNRADYGGSVVFESYSVEESVQGSAFRPVQVLNAVADSSTAVGGLAAGTSYAFLVRTTDGCSGAPDCQGVASNSTTSSSSEPWTTPANLTVTINASTHVVEAGVPVHLDCAAIGGARPYQYSWSFADGSTARGANVSHAYTAPGNYASDCSVEDASSARASNSTIVSVLPNGASSNGTNGSRGNGGGAGSNGSGSSSGSGGNGGGSPGSSPGGGSIGEQPPVPSGVGPLAAAAILIGFIAAVIWLATLVNRRRPGAGSAYPEESGPDPPEPGPSGVPPGARWGLPDPEPSETAVVPILPSSAPPPPPPSADPPLPGNVDLDGLMDQMEDLAPR